MNEEKKKKLIAIGFPAIGILIMGFILFYDGSDTLETNDFQNDDINMDVANTQEKSNVNLDSKSDVYNSEKDKFKVPKSKYSISEDDFFNVDTEEEDDFFSSTPKDTVKQVVASTNPYSQPVQQPQQKVIVKHIYHNTAPKTSQPKKQVKQASTQPVQPVKRRRTRDGFNSAQVSDKGDIFSKKFANAYVHNRHSIKSGDKIEFILDEDCVVGGKKVPRNTILIGVSKLNGNRMNVIISSVRIQNEIYNCSLNVHDKADAQEGIFLHGDVNQEIGQDAINQAGRGVNINVPMIGTIQTGALKKANNPTVTIPSKTKVLIQLKK